jgi:uncharacterized OsmC-like protein
MDDQEPIRAALERTVRAISTKPAFGQGTKSTRVRLRPGLECEVEDGPWKFAVGMGDAFGGTDQAPNPGVYGRAALGSCLAITYSMWAARLGVAIDSLEVEVHADYDARGELGIDDGVRPGYLAMRYTVTVDSEASEEAVMQLLDTADRHSSWLDDLANPVPVTREVRFAKRTTEVGGAE